MNHMKDRKNIFCTLFDSKYIDKGIALYQSLEKVSNHFKLYVFAFDEIAYRILVDLAYEHMIVISLEEFETEEMLLVKKERSSAEYCWTCTPITIEYVLEKFNEPECTYIDADLYFFKDPQILLSEIYGTDDSVIITEHRFSPEIREKGLYESGKYCVQFNTFLNNENAKKVLSWWKKKCLEWCFYTREGDKKGDQKYLESWMTQFNGIHELQHLGGGVAPWNVSQYELLENEEIQFKYIDKNFDLVFYHFQNIRYLPFGFVNIKSGTKEAKVKERIYIPYLNHINQIRAMLYKKYDLTFSIKKSYFKNPILRFIQNYIMPFKITDLSHIINLRKI